MRLPLFFLGFAMTAFSIEQPTKASDITYEYLVETGEQMGYCDHIPHIQKIFENYKVKVFFEFGLGYSTKYFLDSCTKVISVEFITPGDHPEWMKRCLDLYKDYSNWVPVAYLSNYSGDFSWAPYKFFSSHNFWEATSYFARTHQTPPNQDAYLAELRTFINNLTKYNKIDIALVDPGSMLRGPLVQLLFDKAPIILACDCGSSRGELIGDIYGYRAVVTPDHYEKIFISSGKGTLIWIKKGETTDALIQVMNQYAASL